MDIAELRHIFASRIRELREGKLNQGEFADSVGISRGAMSYYEQEARTPDIGVLRAICVKYNISADYLLGIIPDPNHSISDVCHETGLSAEAARRLCMIAKLVSIEFESPMHMLKIFDQDFHEAMKHTPFISVPEVLKVLLESDEGLQIITYLGAIILGVEFESNMPKRIVLKSSSKNFQIAIPIENFTSALWVDIQNEAARLRDKLEGVSQQPE